MNIIDDKILPKLSQNLLKILEDYDIIIEVGND